MPSVVSTRYAKQTTQSTMKAFRAYIRFSKENQVITAETAAALQEAAGAHVLNKDRTQSYTALFPQLIQEMRTLPRAPSKSGLGVGGPVGRNRLTWRRLALLQTDELETLMAGGARLAPWIRRWLEVRGGAPGSSFARSSEPKRAHKKAIGRKAFVAW